MKELLYILLTTLVLRCFGLTLDWGRVLIVLGIIAGIAIISFWAGYMHKHL
jgi:hypothetical protein